MQTAALKYDIISWITALQDVETIKQLHSLAEKQKMVTVEIPLKGIVPPRRKGSLTEGFGFWADSVPFDETNYRNKLWQTERNVW